MWCLAPVFASSCPAAPRPKWILGEQLCSAVIRDWAHNGEAGDWAPSQGSAGTGGHYQLYTLACLNCEIDMEINTNFACDIYHNIIVKIEER